MKRRNFILAVGSLASAPAAVQAAALAALPPTPSTLRMAGFRELVGQQFIAYRGKRGSTLDLAAVRPGKAVPHQEQFTLFFAGSEGLEAGIYDFDNSATGRLQIYMEPARDGLYRADFCLLV